MKADTERNTFKAREFEFNLETDPLGDEHLGNAANDQAAYFTMRHVPDGNGYMKLFPADIDALIDVLPKLRMRLFPDVFPR